MIIGIDAGGTNTDGVLLGGDGLKARTKIPSTPDDLRGIRKVLHNLRSSYPFRSDEIERVVIGTTLILNSITEEKTGDCGLVLISGPGLNPDLAEVGEYSKTVKGYVDHRGRVVEELDPEQVSDFARSHRAQVDCWAVVGKFSPRNPELEEKAAGVLDSKPTTLGSEVASDLGFPLRSTAAVLNAKSKAVFEGFTETLDQLLDEEEISAPVYFIKSDGAMVERATAATVPSLTIKSGPAVSTLGLYALTGVENALAIDIGGTTTDIGIIVDGEPRVEDSLSVAGQRTFFSSIESVDIPLGGDSLVEVNQGEVRIRQQREGQAAAFGGSYPTLTDALHVMEEFTLGSKERSTAVITDLAGGTRLSTEELSAEIVREFTWDITDRLESFVRDHENLTASKRPIIVGGGVLSQFMVPRIADQTGFNYRIPEHADVAGAVGCGVSIVSLRTGIHIDTAQGKMTVNGQEKGIEEGKQFDRAQLLELAERETIRVSRNAGLKSEAEEKVRINSIRYFNVVEYGRVAGQICDIEAQVKPGLAADVDPGQLRS